MCLPQICCPFFSRLPEKKNDFFEVPLKKLNGGAMKLMDRILDDPKSS